MKNTNNSIIKNVNDLKDWICFLKNKDTILCQCEKCNKQFLFNAKSAKKYKKTVLLCRACNISDSKCSKTDEEKRIINDKREQTNLIRFGVTTPLVLEESRENLKKIDKIAKKLKMEKTKKEKYGDSHYNNRPKAEKTMNEKYGCHSSKVDIIKQKKEKTCLKKYGNTTSIAAKQIREKSLNTKLEKYGNANYNNTEKREKTCLMKYGVKNPMQNNEIKEKSINNKSKSLIFSIGYLYNNIHFDSSWELAYYIWLTDNKRSFIYHPPYNLNYIDDNGIPRDYFPDFLVDGKFIEIKGEQFFDKDGNPYNLYKKETWYNKYKLLIENNITIIRQAEINTYLKYIKNTYGKNYLKQFKIKK